MYAYLVLVDSLCVEFMCVLVEDPVSCHYGRVAKSALACPSYKESYEKCGRIADAVNSLAKISFADSALIHQEASKSVSTYNADLYWGQGDLFVCICSVRSIFCSDL